jgi:hypothetical protein
MKRRTTLPSPNTTEKAKRAAKRKRRGEQGRNEWQQ